MTTEALERLQPKSRDTLETFSILIWRAKQEDNQEMRTEFSMKLKGYLRALVDGAVLTDLESKVLYLYFIGKDWTDKN